MPYTPYYPEWQARPATDTPITVGALSHFDDGILAAHQAAEAAQSAAEAAEAAIPDTSDFVTADTLTSELAGKADTADIPDVSGLATEASVTAVADDVAALVARVEALENPEG